MTQTSPRRVIRWLLPVTALLVAGCASEPIPDYRYFRFAAATPPVAVSPRPAAMPLVVGALQADGVYGERPILYATREDTVRLSQYHYQLWNDPPTALVRQRLVEGLEAHRVASLVTTRLSPRVKALRLSGRIEAFQRVRASEGDRVEVTLLLRIERDGEHLPLLEKRYRQRQEVAGAGIEAAVRQFGMAVDAIVVELAADLAALGEG